MSEHRWLIQVKKVRTKEIILLIIYRLTIYLKNITFSIMVWNRYLYDDDDEDKGIKSSLVKLILCYINQNLYMALFYITICYTKYIKMSYYSKFLFITTKNIIYYFHKIIHRSNKLLSNIKKICKNFRRISLLYIYLWVKTKNKLSECISLLIVLNRLFLKP